LKIQDQFRRENWQAIIAGGMGEGEGEWRVTPELLHHWQKCISNLRRKADRFDVGNADLRSLDNTSRPLCHSSFPCSQTGSFQ
jgi:hypothetical protein